MSELHRLRRRNNALWDFCCIVVGGCVGLFMLSAAIAAIAIVLWRVIWTPA